MFDKTSRSVAAALALAAPAAFAQGSVTIYGTLDAGLQYSDTGVPGAGSIKSLSSGNQYANRLGFRGSEDLGGGMHAVFNLEHGLDLDTGAAQTLGTGAFWARRAHVGLKGSFGEVLLGRDYTPGFWFVFLTDRNLYGLPGTVSIASQLSDARANNGIFYTTPSFSGLSGRLAVAAGEGVTGKFYGGSVEYRNGGLFATAAVQRRDTFATATAPAGSLDQHGIGTNYRFGNYAVNAAYWATDPVDGAAGSLAETQAFWVGASATFGVHVVYAQVAKTSLDFVGGSTGRAVTWGLSYNYLLSKSTSLYASYGGVSNDAHARLALTTGTERIGGAVAGADPKALVAGLLVKF